MSKSVTNSRQGSTTLQDSKQPPAQVKAPELRFHTLALYDGPQGRSVLCPGQVLPLWKGTRRLSNVEFHGYSAVVQDNKLITASGLCPDLNDLRTLVDAPASDISTRRELAKWEQMPLGNCGGRRVIRPDVLPLGLMPFQTRYAEAYQQQLSFNQLSVLQWARALSHAQVCHEPYQRFQFWTRGQGTRCLNPITGAWEDLAPVDLPFSWYSPLELGLIDNKPGAEDRLALSLMAGITALGLAEAEIFVGAAPFGEQEDQAMTLDEYRSVGFLNPVWVIPYEDELPLVPAGDASIFSHVGALTSGGNWTTGRVDPIAAPLAATAGGFSI